MHNRQRYFILLFPLSRLFFFIFLVNTANVFAQVKTIDTQVAPEIDYEKTDAPMPTVRLVSYSGSVKYITTELLKNDANLFIMMFKPGCSHCENETRMLEQHSALFKKSKLVLMTSPVQQEILPDFVHELHLADYASIYVGIDSGDFISKAFLYQSLPQINIYNADRKLLKIFTGDVPIDSLEGYIQ